MGCCSPDGIPRRWALVGGRLLDPASRLDVPGSVLIEGDTIVDCGPGLFSHGRPDGLFCLELNGAVVVPGVVDLRVTPAGKLSEVSHLAARGGITSFACIPDDVLPCDTTQSVAWLSLVQLGGARAIPIGAITRGRAGRNLCELGLLAQAGAVAFTDGDLALADTRLMTQTLRYASGFGLPIIQHPEEPALAIGGSATASPLANSLGLPGIPAQAEVIMIERDLRLLEITGGRYHAGHISTKASVEAVRQGKRRGLQVTCDTAPAYFTLTEQAVANYHTDFKLSPPLRTREDNLAIIQGLADGTIDAVASDHIHYQLDVKRVPFAQAGCGMRSINLLLQLVLELHRQRQLDLMTALRVLTCGPADALGCPGGRLKRGGVADLVVLDRKCLDSQPLGEAVGWWLAEPSECSQRLWAQPGRILSQLGKSWVLHTVVAGRLVFSAGRSEIG